MSDSLQRLKNYIDKQYKDIPVWEHSQEAQDARIDELQCIETFIDYLIKKEDEEKASLENDKLRIEI